MDLTDKHIFGMKKKCERSVLFRLSVANKNRSNLIAQCYIVLICMGINGENFLIKGFGELLTLVVCGIKNDMF